MSRVTRRRPVIKVTARSTGTSSRKQADVLAVEEPLEIRLNGEPYTVTMRTPGHDIELAHGLLSAEGIIAGPEDVVTGRYCAGSVMDDEFGQPQNTYNVLDIQLAPGIKVPEARLRRAVTNSSCGVCGTASIHLLRQDAQFDLGADDLRMPAELVLELPDRLRDAQKVFDSTGGLHGVGLFDARGELLVAREDVGRHNATDKVIGWAMLNGLRPARGCVLVVSGRTSFELAQKAVMAGIPMLVGVSAPSSLAVEVAEETGMTLAGFVRGDRMNIYAGAERVLLERNDRR
ncbi:formate dehydrogenase accessory sulfurtransferase FdhD [Aestuariimicrobium sp. p3-SID1156]|uniref:formate dehydrogenase accessory sulfurtransferase FdhD n=1 Tax=Aestuariimicrobium sp. p3-SID1156 TaxID=2916038 RepID=UPI00223AE9AF|nr:formate dehydrogenase accessory sulfurtransferase FdhD [Aestuariimicrobium sp. p3-SID1156]MCT1459366.1 formate dehydrogenase accessory sulfurtransferase FdhD [Aestuariimicrobium sp. p3-SID1156]